MTEELSGLLALDRSRAQQAILVMFLFLWAGSSSAVERTTADFVIHDQARPLSEIAFETGDGSAATLDRFRGKVVLLNLWATWCGPCRIEMPTLDRLQAALGGAAFDVVALSLDRAGSAPVRRFYDANGIANLAIYIDRSGRSMRSLSASVLPTTLLIGPDGKEVGRLIGAAHWDSPEMLAYLREWIGKLSRRAGTERAAATYMTR